MSKRTPQDNTEYMKRYYEERRKAGLCVSCGELAAQGRKYCPECLAKNRERNREARNRYRLVCSCNNRDYIPVGKTGRCAACGLPRRK